MSERRMTNADSICSKNDAELAEFLVEHTINALRSPAVYHGRITKEQMVKAELDWLKQEA